jgi:hypothetical protein
MSGGLRYAALHVALPMAFLLAACANQGPGSPGDTFELRRGIAWYYESKGWERNATCLQPRMSITDLQVVEETAEQLVLNVRYFYDDRSYGRQGWRGGVGMGFPRYDCSGSSERTFVVAKRQGGGYSVTSMTGPQRD